MKWFKHDSNASIDAKLKRLRLKYGMEGYGLYWYLLECIARTIEPHNLTFELEEDAELIAAEVNIHRDRVEEMMLFLCEQGLFENVDGRITCLKMASRSDEYTLKLIRKENSIQTNSGQAPDKVPPIRIEEKDKKDKEPNVADQLVDIEKEEAVERIWRLFPKKVAKPKCVNKLEKLPMITLEKIEKDLRTRVWNPDPRYILNPYTYINQERWLDEVSAPEQKDDELYV